MQNYMLNYQNSPEHILNLVRLAGAVPLRSPEVLTAALAQAQTKSFPEALNKARDFFAGRAVFVPSGLDRVPGAWLEQLPEVLWLTRKPHWSHLPYMIRSLDFRSGVVCLTFAQELPNPEERITAWDRLRVQVNCLLFPNLWSTLPARLEKAIWDNRPDLRSEMFKVGV